MVEPRWKGRFDDAVALLRGHGRPGWIDDRISSLERALHAADADDRRLSAALDTLDPDATSRALKDALRDRDGAALRAGDDVDRRIDSLRRRHDTVHQLLDRRDAIAARVEAVLADLEVLAVESVGSAALSEAGDAASLDGHLRRLDEDLAALTLAREELRDL